jgi:tungstate transport system substrate-binding protein
MTGSERTKFVAEGNGIDLRDVMFNDFVLVGPKADPSDVRGLKDAKEALKRIASEHAMFASRGDDSGTNRLELRLWKAADVDLRGMGAGGGWYRELGSGMGPTLNTSAGLNAYTLADRATWANSSNRQSLEILVKGDPALFNLYGSILVNPQEFPSVKADDARRWHEWLTSVGGRRNLLVQNQGRAYSSRQAKRRGLTDRLALCQHPDTGMVEGEEPDIIYTSDGSGGNYLRLVPLAVPC